MKKIKGKSPVKKQAKKKTLTSISKIPKANIEATGINELIQTALKNKSGVEQLKELMKMKYEYEEREASKIFHQKFCDMQSELPVIPKTKSVKVNGQLIYKYAPLETIVEAIKPCLKRYGFSYHWTESFDKEGMKKITCHITGHGHTESASIDLPIMSASKMTNNIQQAGSTSTYGKRYSLSGILGIMVDEDNDGRIEDKRTIVDVTPTISEIAKKGKEQLKNKYTLPEEIFPDTICNLGAYKNNPKNYGDIPLDNLLMLYEKSDHRERLTTIINHVAEKLIMKLSKEIGYDAEALNKYIVTNFKRDNLLEMDWQEKLKCIRAMTNVKNKIKESRK